MIKCTLSGHDDYGCTTLKLKTITARKNHICEECNREIKKGELYEFYNGIFEGEFFCTKTCLDCVSLRDSFFPMGGYLTGNIRDEIGEHIVYELGGEVDEKCIVQLTPAMKDLVFGLMEEGWKRDDKSRP